MNYLIFNTTTGQITKRLDIPDWDTTTLAFNVASTESSIAADNEPTKSYVTNPGTTPVVVDKPLLTTVATWDKTTFTADGSDGCTITSLPTGTTVTVNPGSVGGAILTTDTVNDGTFVFKANTAGSYTVTISVFPYLDYLSVLTGT